MSTYVFVMLSIVQSQFIEKCFKKAQNSEQNVVLLLFLFLNIRILFLSMVCNCKVYNMYINDCVGQFLLLV